jgi:hypothetical protein
MEMLIIPSAKVDEDEVARKRKRADRAWTNVDIEGNIPQCVEVV